MATIDQFYADKRGPGAHVHVAQSLSLTMAAGATASGSLSLPSGSWLASVRFETATAFSGSPTNINARCGTAAAGQQVVADVDVKAQGHSQATIVAAFDVQGAAGTTYYFQIAAVGGTSPAGTVVAVVSYYAPIL
jgi:hypothetical protein